MFAEHVIESRPARPDRMRQLAEGLVERPAVEQRQRVQRWAGVSAEQLTQLSEPDGGLRTLDDAEAGQVANQPVQTVWVGSRRARQLLYGCLWLSGYVVGEPQFRGHRDRLRLPGPRHQLQQPGRGIFFRFAEMGRQDGRVASCGDQLEAADALRAIAGAEVQHGGVLMFAVAPAIGPHSGLDQQ